MVRRPAAVIRLRWAAEAGAEKSGAGPVRVRAGAARLHPDRGAVGQRPEPPTGPGQTGPGLLGRPQGKLLRTFKFKKN